MAKGLLISVDNAAELYLYCLVPGDSDWRPAGGEEVRTLSLVMVRHDGGHRPLLILLALN